MLHLSVTFQTGLCAGWQQLQAFKVKVHSRAPPIYTSFFSRIGGGCCCWLIACQPAEREQAAGCFHGRSASLALEIGVTPAAVQRSHPARRGKVEVSVEKFDTAVRPLRAESLSATESYLSGDNGSQIAGD